MGSHANFAATRWFTALSSLGPAGGEIPQRFQEVGAPGKIAARVPDPTKSAMPVWSSGRDGAAALRSVPAGTEPPRLVNSY
jgi:hypothetical protein